MKQALLLLTLALISCRKPTRGGTSGSSSNPALDTENYVIIDGITNYHYSYTAPTVTCSNDIYGWNNLNPNQPNYTIGFVFQNLNYGQAIISHQANGKITSYYLKLSPSGKLSTKVVNNKTVLEFTNLKMYLDVLGDTTGPYKLVTAKCTCNGK